MAFFLARRLPTNVLMLFNYNNGMDAHFLKRHQSTKVEFLQTT
jgi:hypothetical protein